MNESTRATRVWPRSILLDFDDGLAVEAHKQDVRRETVDPVLLFGVLARLTDLSIGRSLGGKHRVAVHADQDLMIFDSILEFGRNGRRIQRSWGMPLEIQRG